VEYRFDWGDGTYSAWSPQPSATKTYSTPGTYFVRAQARCAVNPSVTSGWSAALSVTITPRDPCAGVTGYTAKYYTWRYRLTTRTVSCHIPNYLICRSEHADELAGIPRTGSPPYAGVWQLVTWPEDDAFLRELANAINRGLTDYYEIATNTLHFIEALMSYTSEVDYWQTPVETLYLQRGDCEDGAILYVALLRALGYPVYFGSWWSSTLKTGHVFAWVEVAKSWVDWCESRPNKCRDLLGCWTIAVVNGKYYAIAEPALDPSILSAGYWGLGCGCIPAGAQSYIIFPPGEGTTAQPATILSCPCSN
jgi:transglutaminase-like putative cysteine protease